MAGAGFKVWTTGDLVNASDFNSYVQEQVVMVFADSSARDSAVTSPSEGMFCFLQDTNTLQFYDGSSWANFIGEGDITGVTAGAGLTGGGTSGAVSLAVDINGQTSTTVAGGDEVIVGDISDSNNIKKTTAQDIAGTLDIAGQTAGTPTTADLLLIADVTDSNNIKKVTAQEIVNLGGGGAAFNEFLLIGA